MGEYIFRFPAGMPELSFETLAPLVTAACGSCAHCASCHLRIGTTVTVRWASRGISGALIVRLYDLDIAWLYPDRVEFTATDDPHQSTTEWLAQILRDNGIAIGCWRVRRRKADGPGPLMARGRAGLLVMAEYDSSDGRREVFGKTYLVDPARQAARRAELARWAEFKAGRLTWDQAFAGAPS